MRSVALLLPLMLGACAAPPALPTLPPGVLPLPAELPFGSAVSNADTRAWVTVFDALKPEHSRLRLRSFLLAADVPPASLKRYYDRALLAQGWRAVSLPNLRTRRAWCFGYRRGGFVFAVVGLNSSYAARVTGIPGRSGAVSVLPLNILTDVPVKEGRP